jgi:exopolysaccharide production protein ExoQ
MSTSVATNSWYYYEKQPIWHFVSSWILLIPLLFFATKGGFLHPNDPAHMGEYTTSVTSETATLDRVEQIGIWVLCLVMMIPKVREVLADLINFKIIAAIPLLAIASAAWAPDPFESFRRGIYLFLTVVFGMYLAERYLPEQQMRLVFFVGYAAAILSVITVFLAPRYGLGFAGEWKGIFGHKNDLGVFMIFLLTPAFHLRPTTLPMQLGRLIYILLGLLLIFESQSKTAWVICLVYMAYVFAARYLGRFKRIDQVFLVLLAASAVLFVSFVVYQNVDLFTGVLGKDATFSGRTRIWSAVLTSISKRPLLGYGYGGFWRGLSGESGNVISSVGFGVPHAHSGYLNIWLQIGAIGLGMFLASLFIALRNAFKCFKPDRPIWVDWYAGLLLLVVLANLDESYILNINEMTTILFVMAYIGLSRLARPQMAYQARSPLASVA